MRTLLVTATLLLGLVACSPPDDNNDPNGTPDSGGQSVEDMAVSDASRSDDGVGPGERDQGGNPPDTGGMTPDSGGGDVDMQTPPVQWEAPTAEVVEVSSTNARIQLTPSAQTPPDAMVGVAFAEHEAPTVDDMKSREVTPGEARVSTIDLDYQLRPLTRYWLRPYVRVGEEVFYGETLPPFTTPFLKFDESYAGGWVGAVDEDRALILHISTSSNASFHAFGCDGVTIEHPLGGNGRDHTEAILKACPEADAASYCASLEPRDGVTGWFLATSGELNRMRDLRLLPPFQSFWTADRSASDAGANVWMDGKVRTAVRSEEHFVPCMGWYDRRTRGVPTGFGALGTTVIEDMFPGGSASHCGRVTCPDGMTALGGGGFYNQAQLKTYASPDPEALNTFERCLVGKTDTVMPSPNQLRVSCATVESEVRVSTMVADVSAGEATSLSPNCFEQEVLIGGGGGGLGIRITANEPTKPNSRRAWRVRGEALEDGELRAYALCATGVEQPVMVNRRVTLPRGGQCANVECPEGTFRLTGGADWAGMQPGESRPGGPGDWVTCAINPGGETLSMTVLCTPARP